MKSDNLSLSLEHPRVGYLIHCFKNGRRFKGLSVEDTTILASQFLLKNQTISLLTPLPFDPEDYSS